MFNDFPNDCGREAQRDIEYKESQRNNGKVTPGDFLLFQHKRMITFLFKQFLIELEELLAEGLISDDYFNSQRKAILDRGNNFIREFEDHLNKCDIRFRGKE